MTKLRHMAATLVSGLLTEGDRNDLAAFMMHSSTVQQRTYNKCLSTLKNVRISTILSKILTESAVDEELLKDVEFGMIPVYFIWLSSVVWLYLWKMFLENLVNVIFDCSEVPGYDIKKVKLGASANSRGLCGIQWAM